MKYFVTGEINGRHLTVAVRADSIRLARIHARTDYKLRKISDVYVKEKHFPPSKRPEYLD